MSAETCTRSQCPEMPKVTLDQAVIDLMESIALQETALSHILCAESQKMKVAMGLDGLDLCKLLEVNDSATNMVHAVANLELVLKDKLEFISNTSTIRLPAAAVPLTSRPSACPGAGRAFLFTVSSRKVCIKTGKCICWNC